MLISARETFDYIEGFVIINRTGLLNNWRSSFNPQDPVQASRFDSDGRILFCLEMTKNFNRDEADVMHQVIIPGPHPCNALSAGHERAVTCACDRSESKRFCRD